MVLDRYEDLKRKEEQGTLKAMVQLAPKRWAQGAAASTATAMKMGQNIDDDGVRQRYVAGGVQLVIGLILALALALSDGVDKQHRCVCPAPPRLRHYRSATAMIGWRTGG